MSEPQHKNETDTSNAEGREENVAANPDTPAAAAVAPAETVQSDSGKGNGFLGVIAFVALIVALGAFIAGYISLQEINRQQAGLDQRVAGLESGAESVGSLARTVQENNQSMQQHLDAMEEKVAGLDSRVEETLAELQQRDTALRQSIERIQESLNAGKDDDLLVAEARHLITIANQQSRLAYNPAAAAAALEAANQRLSQAGDPALLEVRKLLTDDIVALRNIGELDISGIALTLSGLEQAVDTLPLQHEEPQDDTAEAPAAARQEVSSIEGFFAKIWHDLKGLVTIRRNSEQGAALLPPGQRFFLQQNLRLKLEAARLALLQRDTQTFHASLETAEQWLRRYFDTSAPSTANMLTTLSPYQALELQPELPDISAALGALNEWREKRLPTAGAEGGAS